MNTTEKGAAETVADGLKCKRALEQILEWANFDPDKDMSMDLGNALVQIEAIAKDALGIKN